MNWKERGEEKRERNERKGERRERVGTSGGGVWRRGASPEGHMRK